MGKPKNLSFVTWINDTGVTEIAKLLDINVSTVRHWRLGNSLPRTHQMQAIKKLTKGRVSYEAMIDGTTQNQSGK